MYSIPVHKCTACEEKWEITDDIHLDAVVCHETFHVQDSCTRARLFGEEFG